MPAWPPKAGGKIPLSCLVVLCVIPISMALRPCAYNPLAAATFHNANVTWQRGQLAHESNHDRKLLGLMAAVLLRPLPAFAMEVITGKSCKVGLLPDVQPHGRDPHDS